MALCDPAPRIFVQPRPVDVLHPDCPIEDKGGPRDGFFSDEGDFYLSGRRLSVLPGSSRPEPMRISPLGGVLSGTFSKFRVPDAY